MQTPLPYPGMSFGDRGGGGGGVDGLDSLEEGAKGQEGQLFLADVINKQCCCVYSPRLER